MNNNCKSVLILLTEDNTDDQTTGTTYQAHTGLVRLLDKCKEVKMTADYMLKTMKVFQSVLPLLQITLLVMQSELTAPCQV